MHPVQKPTNEITNVHNQFNGIEFKGIGDWRLEIQVQFHLWHLIE